MVPLSSTVTTVDDERSRLHSVSSILSGRSSSFANLRCTQTRKEVARALPRRRKGFRSEIFRESFRRSGKYARRVIREAALSEDTGCSKLRWILAQVEVEESSILSALVRAGQLSESESVQLLARISKLSSSVPDALCQRILSDWKLGSILFTTPELGKWSTYGGLGVMVDDLINTMAPLVHSESADPSIWVCSPYYERNRKGESGYLAKDNVCWTFNVDIDIGIDRVTVGVYEGVINGIRHFFLHNATYFPSIYPDFQPMMRTAFLALMAKCPLEICCHLGKFPRTIVTNDWATGLTAAYAREGFFGSVFNSTKFMHITHNLDQNYEGRIYPYQKEDLGLVHKLPTELLVDPHWSNYCVNPSRCAIMTSDNWGTVSFTYRKELMEESPLAPLLRRHPFPFAHPNGIPVEARLAKLRATGYSDHWEAKKALQIKYFGGESRPDTVLLAFIGRITFQKGIHLILDVADHLLRSYEGKVQILIAGAANQGEEYAQHCCGRLRELNWRYPLNFWSDPDSFFLDGPLLNLGADFGLMPSAFEPGGIVQQEFMLAGTPVIAFKTGGLKDTISEFYQGRGNGFTFESHFGGDLAHAIQRAVHLFRSNPEGYNNLRKNAQESVVSCDMVARAWLREFYRMHNKIYVDLTEVETAVKKLQNVCSPVIEEVETEAESSFTSEESEIEVYSPSSSSLASTMQRSCSMSGIGSRRSIRVSFKPKSTQEIPKHVLLAGSFDHWASRIPLKWETSAGLFIVDIRVPQGKWQIKLIADGNWICIDEYPMERDLHGNVNNVILVD